MGWLPRSYAACDTCGFERVVLEDRDAAIQLLRAGGWHHMRGKTLGGQEFETILCRKCAKDERRRTRVKEEVEQDALPLNWEEGRIVVGKQGVQSR